MLVLYSTYDLVIFQRPSGLENRETSERTEWRAKRATKGVSSPSINGADYRSRCDQVDWMFSNVPEPTMGYRAVLCADFELDVEL